jgi:hypothetical protein
MDFMGSASNKMMKAEKEHKVHFRLLYTIMSVVLLVCMNNGKISMLGGVRS